MNQRETVAGLDIGTTKVCCIVGQRGDDDTIEIIGVGNTHSDGLRKGVVVNLESTVKSVSRAIEDAELMAGVQIDSLYVGITGAHIKGVNSRGVIAVSRSDKEITSADVDRVIDAAKAISIPLDREVIHVLPQEFIIDDQDGIKDPVGMTGTRLEAEVHIVTGAITSAQNIVQCVTRAGFGVEDIVLEPLASSYAVLTEDEKELGVILVDIGGGTTDIVVFINGSIWHTEVLSIGGIYVTNDISVGLRTPRNEAEKIKIAYGCAMKELVQDDEEIEVPSVGGRKSNTLPRKILVEIIEPRMEEIFSLINQCIKKTGYEPLVPAGVVLTGGASSMPGVVQLAEKILDVPVRLGSPKNVSGLVDVINSPIYATGVGLTQYGFAHSDEAHRERFSGGDLFRGIKTRMKEWFGDLLY